MNCCFCDKIILGKGHNPKPISGDVCCDECNLDIVVPLRIFNATNQHAILITTKGNIELINLKNRLFTLKDLQESINGQIERYPIDMPEYKIFIDKESFSLELPYNKLANQTHGIDVLGNVLIVPEALIK